MRYKIFGRHTGLKVSEYALGTGRLGLISGQKPDAAEARRVLAGFAEVGGNFLDTSDAYLGGEAERMVGEFIASNRDDFVVSSKYGRTAGASPSLGVLGNTRKSMAHAVEQSLKRLRTDHVDLYLTHFNDGVTPIEEIVRGCDELARAGKILYAGFSNFPAWRVAVGATMAGLRGFLPVSAIQVEYNVLQRTAERELLPMADGLGLGVMGYSPLAGGLLTAKHHRAAKGQANGAPGESAPAPDPHRERVLGTLVTIAAELATDPGTVATAWVTARGVVPILGAKTRAHLDGSLAGLAVRLSAASALPPGYPHELTASAGLRAMSTGDRWDQIDFPERTTA